MTDQPPDDREDARVRALAQVDHNLTNHAPKDRTVIDTMEYVRNIAKSLGHTIVNNCPESRERSLALTNLEQTVMWAVAAIARNQ